MSKYHHHTTPSFRIQSRISYSLVTSFTDQSSFLPTTLLFTDQVSCQQLSTSPIMSGQGSGQGYSGDRPTGATGGGSGKYQCANYGRPGHPSAYRWVSQYGQLCADCLVSAPSSTVPWFLMVPTAVAPATNQCSSAHPATESLLAVYE